MGFILLALVLVGLATSGIYNARAALSGEVAWRAPVPTAVLFAAYAAAAFWAAAGLWRVARWAFAAFAVWSAVAMLAVLLFIVDRASGQVAWGPLLETVAFLAVALWYVRSRQKQAAERATADDS